MGVRTENRWKRRLIDENNEVGDKRREREILRRPPVSRRAPPPITAEHLPNTRSVRAWMQRNAAEYEGATQLAEAANVAFDMPEAWLDDADHWVWELAAMAAGEQV